MTGAQLRTAFQGFMTKWLGRTIDYDRVFKYQCVDLILEYIYECFGIASGVSGNAIDYWTKTGVNGFNDPLIAKFDKITSNEAEEGDIVILHGLPGNSDGHIGIATGNINATHVEILEQNGGNGNGDGNAEEGNAIRVRYVERIRVAGLLRPKVEAAPPTPAPVVHPYRIETIDPKQVKLNKNTHLWGLNYDNLTAILNNPQADAVAGTMLTVRAILHHNIGYDYYLTDPKVASGYNVVDCDNYTPKPKPAPANDPYVPPAAPLTIPSSETFEVIKDIKGYLTSNMAINHIGQSVEVPAGTYFVFNKRFQVSDPKELWAVNVTKTPGRPGAWIATADNVETPPEPEKPVEEEKPVEPAPVQDTQPEPEWRSTYRPLSSPEVYIAMRDLPVVDPSGENQTLLMPMDSVTDIAGTYNIGGVEYARLKSAADKGLFYGVEWTDRATNTPNLELESEVFNSKTTISERSALHNLSLVDKAAFLAAHAKRLILGFAALLGKINLSTNKNKN